MIEVDEETARPMLALNLMKRFFQRRGSDAFSRGARITKLGHFDLSKIQLAAPKEVPPSSASTREETRTSSAREEESELDTEVEKECRDMRTRVRPEAEDEIKPS
ncbi:MAG: hypothetical protein LQ350_007105 [Teloschistes chrysophthalmus]|nr:MAG: hypothetical protein LQ350_007105 [Niorma chrysophthalma]